MLTAGQCEVVAAMIDGDVICLDCADKEFGDDWQWKRNPPAEPIIKYTASSEFGEYGLYCGTCGKEIVEPPEPEPEEEEE